MPNIRKHPKHFECVVCKKTFSNKGSKPKRIFCSLHCYHESKQFKKMIFENGKKHLGMKHWWGHKISLSKIGVPRFNIREKNHWAWKGGSNSRETEMGKLKYKEWRRKVFERDNYTCRICGDRNGNGKTIKLVAHHKAYWNEYPELRYDVNNGMTICNEDHIIGHQLFGYK